MSQIIELDNRCKAMVPRIALLSEPIQLDENWEVSLVGRLRDAISELSNEAIIPLQEISVDVDGPLQSVREGISSLIDASDELPSQLNSFVTEKMTEAETHLSEVFSQAGGNLDHEFSDAKEKIARSIEEAFRHLNSSLSEAEDRIKSTLGKNSHAISNADDDLHRTVRTLETALDTVLSACRSTSIGAQAAGRAVAIATNRFAGVN